MTPSLWEGQGRARLCRGSFQRLARAAGTCESRVRSAATALYTIVAVMIGGSSTVFACPVCFGADETALIDGAKLGILVLLAITLAVQGAFVAFFIYLRKQAKRVSDVELDAEWSQLQRGGSRTS